MPVLEHVGNDHAAGVRDADGGLREAAASGTTCTLAAMLISLTVAAMPASDAARKVILLAANRAWVSIVLWVASFVVAMTPLLDAMGGLPSAPPQDVPAGVIALVGWTNRAMVVRVAASWLGHNAA